MQRHLTSRIVRHGPRVVVVRPNTGVVIVLGNLVDFVFGLDVPVLGDPQVHPDTRPVPLGQIQPRIRNRLVRTVDRDGTTASAPPNLAAVLVSQRIEIADTGQHLAHVTGLVGHHSRPTTQQALPELLQGIPIG